MNKLVLWQKLKRENENYINALLSILKETDDVHRVGDIKNKQCTTRRPGISSFMHGKPYNADMKRMNIVAAIFFFT